ncbi:hypothetical protein MTsPCn9_24640 [Croceitalea sp. MTPC9]|uniref:DOMON domain-containing protein n=1 Tax=unclassified Croceitalea TaxID=2632280 RepID=UPI002B3D34BB|nr:hypothetical protein MTsPCn6_18900 [Croceitalea sp. MTPC6]GMN17526.1 hypothetical protein MTsPCn9_24640 [Croceitalea sp. MTPC9]
MWNKIILLVVICLFGINQKAPNHIKVEQMDISWEINKDIIEFTATAPDDGWIAIGINSEDNIIGANLYMINVTKNGVLAEDFYVVSAGNPKPVEELGSKSRIINFSGEEINGKTKVKFSIPTNNADDYHFNLKEGEKTWLVCAYSMEDEFDHHSRMRKHVKVIL